MPRLDVMPESGHGHARLPHRRPVHSLDEVPRLHHQSRGIQVGTATLGASGTHKRLGLILEAAGGRGVSGSVTPISEVQPRLPARPLTDVAGILSGLGPSIGIIIQPLLPKALSLEMPSSQSHPPKLTVVTVAVGAKRGS